MQKNKLPKQVLKGVWVHVYGIFFPLEVQTTKEVKVTRGRKVTFETEELPAPVAVLTEFRSDNPNFGQSGIRGVGGHIYDNSTGTHMPEALGETFAVIDGEIVPFEMVAGLTGKEGGLTKGGKPKARHGKYDLGTAGVSVAWANGVYTLRFGISQSTPNGLFFYGSLKPEGVRTERVVSEDSLVSISDLASAALASA